jgi:cytochrome d ubiquinol oxidase subunit I
VDAVLLSRLQFAFVIAFHILLPAFTVGLSAFILVLEGAHVWTRNPLYLRLSVFWTRIFAVSFGMGVVSGIVMPFQFGTNWSGFTDATADVLSPLMAYEGLMAFFLEASFLGVLLFGRRLVPAWAHFFAALMVAFGTLLSSFWILATNSWMQTPQGFKLVDGRFEPVDWLAIIFNPSFPYRLLHTVTGFYITTAFVVMGVGAWLLRRERASDDARMMIRMALDLLIVIVPLQMFLGDQHGLNTLEYQPAKLAAIEGRYDTLQPVPLTVFGIPDDAHATMHDEVEIPELGSLILTHSWSGKIKGLKEWPADQRPPVGPPFFCFRIMVAAAFIMLFVAAAGQVLRWRGRLWQSPLFLWLLQYTSPLGFIAVLCGWITTEVGRQPWTVYGLLRTTDSVSPSLTGTDVVISFACYVAVYLIMYPTGIAMMAGLVRRGPQAPDVTQPVASGRPSPPFESAARAVPDTRS